MAYCVNSSFAEDEMNDIVGEFSVLLSSNNCDTSLITSELITLQSDVIPRVQNNPKE